MTAQIKHEYQMSNRWGSEEYAPALSFNVTASEFNSLEQAKTALAHFLRRFADELERDNHGVPGWVREIVG